MRERASGAHGGLFGGGSARHLLIAFGLLLGLTAAGTAGYVALTDMTPFEALYQTVTTLSTVGFMEVRPLGTAGRTFTMVLIAAGVGAALYAFGALAEFLVAGRIQEILGRRAIMQSIAALRDHVIVCGFGRLGRAVAEELARSGIPLVVIEEDQEVAARFEPGPHLMLVASAADDEALERAGVTRARAVVAATGSEAVNTFIGLAAREANPQIAIHARAETEAGVRRLRRAGATQVVSPYHLAGQRLAHAIVRPAVVDFMELATPGSGAEIDLEEVAIGAGSPLAGDRVATLGSEDLQLSVVAVRRGTGPLVLNPAGEVALEVGDRVVVVGDRRSVMRLAELAAPR